MTSNKTIDVTTALNQADLMAPDEERFDAIMDHMQLHKQRQQWWLPMAAMFVLFAATWLLVPAVELETHNDKQLVQLIDKVNMIELAVLNQSINHSEPGSEVLEKMVSIENWLVQLNTNIAQSTDEQQTLALLNAKLEVLDDLAALQKKFKPKSEEANQPII